uniref:response regulator n=1 Tax=uncultured Bradyrhizobium sp. TaxID=199684 RepID=UPI0026342D82
DGRQGVSVVAEHSPDVVLMDIRMPRLDGLAATDELVRSGSPSKVIVLTTFDADDYVVRALAMGADGFLLKDTPPDDIVAAFDDLRDAIEVDVDAVFDGHETFVGGVLEHIEEAGVHSGDSACSLPPFSLKAETIAELKRQTEAMARALNVVGLMNVQFAIKDGAIYVLEVNPRASRTVPFVAKVIGTPVAKIAARIMAGEKLADFKLKKKKLDHVGVKESVFPFARFPGVDTVLGPEMRSTGEVMGLDRSFEVAFAKSQLGGGTRVPRQGTVFVSVRGDDKMRIADAVRLLHSLGFKVMATSGTQRYLSDNGVPTEKVNKVLEGRPHIVDAITNGDVQLVFNTTEGPQALADSRSLRRAALLHKVPYYTTLSGAVAAARGIRAYRDGDLEVRTLQSYFSES